MMRTRGADSIGARQLSRCRIHDCIRSFSLQNILDIGTGPYMDSRLRGNDTEGRARFFGVSCEQGLLPGCEGPVCRRVIPAKAGIHPMILNDCLKQDGFPPSRE
jgi:hypothetical protein